MDPIEPSSPPPCPAITPCPSPSPPKVEPAGLNPDSTMFRAQLIDDYDAAAEALLGQITRPSERPGMIIIWGVGSASEALEIARGVAVLLKEKLASRELSPPIRAYYKGPSEAFSKGFVYAETFYFTR